MRIKKHPILEFNQKEKIKFTLDGKELEGYKANKIPAGFKSEYTVKGKNSDVQC